VGVFRAVDAFLQDDQTGLLLVVGGPGSGKSSLMLRLGRRLRSSPALHPMIVPLLVELKGLSAGQLPGLLKRVLLDPHEGPGLDPSVAGTLLGQRPECPGLRLVVLLDGLDELQGDVASVRDLLATVCGGLRYPPGVLKVSRKGSISPV
jgi:hypothetical protein